MRIFDLFSRHSAFAGLTSAYADGELRGNDLRRFETHLSECDSCMTSVTEARQLKSVVGRLPLVPAPRSFRVTAAMAREARPAPVAARTPLYLGLARAGAALSVLAFASILAFGAFDTNSDTDGDDDSATSRQASGDAEMAAGAAPEKTSQDSFATAAPTPALAPSSGGGEVVSSGLPTVAAATPGPRLTDSGAVPPVAGEPTDNAYSDPGTRGLALDTPANATSDDDDGLRTVLLVSGALAAGMVVLLVAAETVRRRGHS